MKDSILTSHGILQAERLGQHFAHAGFNFTKIFSSDLQRAYKTAEAVRIAQAQADDELVVIQLPLLREQDFGWYEGKPFSARQRIYKPSAKEVESPQQLRNPDFKDVESRDSMARRAEIFVQNELLPLLHGESSEAESVICVVSHGIILSYLWRSFLKLFPKQSVALGPGVSWERGALVPLEHLGGWSNTGYLQLDIYRHFTVAADASEDFANGTAVPKPEATRETASLLHLPFRMTVMAVNGKDHLQSLKRTRGGVGSSRHDEGQKKIEAFFKKQKSNSSRLE